VVIIVAGYRWYNSGEGSHKELWQSDSYTSWSCLASAQCKNKAACCWPENTARNAAVSV